MLTTHQAELNQVEELNLKYVLNNDREFMIDLKHSWVDSFVDESYDSFNF